MRSEPRIRSEHGDSPPSPKNTRGDGEKHPFPLAPPRHKTAGSVLPKPPGRLKLTGPVGSAKRGVVPALYKRFVGAWAQKINIKVLDMLFVMVFSSAQFRQTWYGRLWTIGVYLPRHPTAWGFLRFQLLTSCLHRVSSDASTRLGPQKAQKKIEMGVKNACDLGDLDTYIYIYILFRLLG